MLSSSIFLCFFFFKQKTAYEMRMSDWSSDVCSSDLHLLAGSAWIGALAAFILMLSRRSPIFEQLDTAHRALAGFATAGTVIVGLVVVRSAERRVGKECVSTCRSRWSTYH